jgi:hypothetical protein
MREMGPKKGQGSARPNAEVTPRRSPGYRAARVLMAATFSWQAGAVGQLQKRAAGLTSFLQKNLCHNFKRNFFGFSKDLECRFRANKIIRALPFKRGAGQ